MRPRALIGAAACGVRALDGAGGTAGDLTRMAHRPRSDSPARPAAEGPGREGVAFPAPIRLRAPGCRPTLRSVDEALHMIDSELPAELARLPRWTFARALLVEASKTGRKRDLTAAMRQVRQALSNEGWLIDNEAADG